MASPKHDPENSRYIIEVDGQLAGFADYVETGTARDFNHTVVLDEFRGQGLSKPLIKLALDDSFAAGFNVVPTCSAFQGFIAKNPEYQRMTLMWPLPFEELSDGMVLLRGLSRDDAPELTLACQDAETVRFTTVPADYTEAMAQEFIAERLHSDKELTWVIELGAEPGRFAGMIDVRLRSQQARSVDVGYHSAPWARGRGAMTRAVRLVSDYCFAQGVHRFELQAYEDNVASRKVAENAGFTFEGVLRDAAATHDGAFVGLATYSRLAGE